MLMYVKIISLMILGVIDSKKSQRLRLIRDKVSAIVGDWSANKVAFWGQCVCLAISYDSCNVRCLVNHCILVKSELGETPLATNKGDDTWKCREVTFSIATLTHCQILLLACSRSLFWFFTLWCICRWLNRWRLKDVDSILIWTARQEWTCVPIESQVLNQCWFTASTHLRNFLTRLRVEKSD